MKIKKHIPNAITCCNLLCGCFAVAQAFDGNLVYSAYLVGLAAVFDFFDGFVARILNVSSPIGKDLDSLADMVTFGVVPGIVLFQMVNRGIMINNKDFELLNYLKFITFLIPVFSAIRLAKFNNDTRQTDSFIGVPTPANSILILSIPLIAGWQNDFSVDYYNRYYMFINPYFLIVLSCILSFLLIAELPLFALKFKHFNWKGNEIRFMFLGLSLGMLVTLQFIGIPLIIILYILLSAINNVLSKKKTVE